MNNAEIIFVHIKWKLAERALSPEEVGTCFFNFESRSMLNHKWLDSYMCKAPGYSNSNNFILQIS